MVKTGFLSCPDEREEGRYACGDAVQLHFQTCYAVAGIVGNTVLGFFDAVGHQLQVVGEEGRSGCWCLHSEERHHIEHALVAVVSYACDDGQRKLCHVLCQSQCVEARHVGCGTASSYDDHTVELFRMAVDFVQGGNDALFHTLALHDGREQLYMEVERTLLNLSAEVAEACCRLT